MSTAMFRAVGWRRSRWRAALHTSTCFRSRADPLKEISKIQVGASLHGYTVEKVTAVPDFDLSAVQLCHAVTGAQHLHLSRRDSNNTFGVAFPTTPLDSSGVSHILEHTALCGSQRFPVRDPFFKMLTRSLATFMNAFTASDWTMYPFSSQNSRDFSNLLSVYLDSAFHPQLRESDFRQEGWRLEHQEPTDPSSPIVFKGVVFNEMKGVFATPENIFSEALQNRLYPDHTYSHVSGGRPIDILGLTWEALKQFHSSHYHPSNSKFYTYGDLPLPPLLEQISSQALGHFQRAPSSAEVPLQSRWSQPREEVIHCAPDPMAPDPLKQTTVSVAFLLAPITDSYETLVLSVLSQLLVDGPASPLYQELLDSNIGSDFAPSTGFDSSVRESCFSVGLQGIKEEDVPVVKQRIWATLERLAEEGFPEERVRAVLHQIELAIKHQSSSFGLAIITSLISPWIHGADPVDSLLINSKLDQFKEDMKTPGFLQDKLRKYFLDNKHTLTLVMTPDVEYGPRLEAEEKEKLREMVSALTPGETEAVYQSGLQLLASQEEEEGDLTCLPSLSTQDVERDTEYTKLEQDFAGGVPVQYTEQPTNGMTYFRAVSSISMLPEQLMIFVPLFCSVITRMGAGDLDHRQFAHECDEYTGGLSMTPHVVAHHSSAAGFDQGVLLHSHCLHQNTPHMLSLWEDVFNSPNLADVERLRALVKMAASALASNVASSGHNFAMTSSASSLSPASRLAELFGGMTQVEFLKGVAEREELSDVVQSLAAIAAEVLDCGSFRCAINTGEGNISSVHDNMTGFISTIPGSVAELPSFTEDPHFQSGSCNMYYQMPFPVHYTAQSFRTVPYTHEDSAKLRILAKLLSSKYLHREIREKGGAYGSGARQNSGIFSFMSYRDPNSVATLEVFGRAVEWAGRGEYSSRDVEEAKLSVFSQVDAPVSPAARGSTLFLSGISDELRQQHRERLFQVCKEDLVSVAQRYLSGDAERSSTVIGPESKQLAQDGQQWTVKTFSD